MKRRPPDLPSLFVVALPRSLSSFGYRVAQQALRLEAPRWTTSGEVFNPDRFVFSEPGTGDRGRFLQPTDEEPWNGAGAYLDAVVRPKGMAYKDVLQPLLIASWLADHPAIRVLRIRRPIADVAFAMLGRGWMFPTRVSRLAAGHSEAEHLIDGLLRASDALDAVTAAEVVFDDLVWDEAALEDALRALYPGVSLPKVRYIDAVFRAEREAVLGRREDPRWRQLDALARGAGAVPAGRGAPARAAETSIVGRSAPESAATTAAAAATAPVSASAGGRRLLIVGASAHATGFGRVVRSIFEPLAAEWDLHQLAVGADPGDDPPWPTTPVPRGADKFGVRQLPGLVDRLRPDAVFLLNDMWIIAQWLRELKRTARRPPALCYFPVEATPVDAVYAAGLLAADALVVYTDFARRGLEAALDALGTARRPPVEVMDHGFDPTRFHPLEIPRRDLKRQLFAELAGVDDPFVVLNANRNQPRKRIDATLEGFASFARDKPPGVKLCLHMGTQDLGWHLDSLARRWGIADRLLLTASGSEPPRLSDTELNRLYNACDVGLNTSAAEGWGMVAMEHAATGAAQVVPRHGALEEIWGDAVDYLDPVTTMVDPTRMMDLGLISSVDVAAKLEALYADPGRLACKARDARARVLDPRFDWARISTRWGERLRRLRHTPAATGGSIQ